MPKGLNIQMVCLNSWLYDEANPFSKVEAIQYYDELRKGLDEGYFEEIITKYILNNNHKTYTMLVPSHTCAAEKEAELTKKLADYKASLSKFFLTATVPCKNIKYTLAPPNIVNTSLLNILVTSTVIGGTSQYLVSFF